MKQLKVMKHQESIVNFVKRTRQKVNYIQSDTGSGKTLSVLLSIKQKIKSGRVLLVVPAIGEINDHFKQENKKWEIGLNFNIITSSNFSLEKNKVNILTNETLRLRLAKKKFPIIKDRLSVFIDEGHKYSLLRGVELEEIKKVASSWIKLPEVQKATTLRELMNNNSISKVVKSHSSRDTLLIESLSTIDYKIFLFSANVQKLDEKIVNYFSPDSSSSVVNKLVVNGYSIRELEVDLKLYDMEYKIEQEMIHNKNSDKLTLIKTKESSSDEIIGNLISRGVRREEIVMWFTGNHSYASGEKILSLSSIKNNKIIKYIIFNMSLKEGVDLPRANSLIIDNTNLKNETLYQLIGRLKRKYPGKKQVYVQMDLLPKSVNYLKRKKRKEGTIYKMIVKSGENVVKATKNFRKLSYVGVSTDLQSRIYQHNKNLTLFLESFRNDKYNISPSDTATKLEKLVLNEDYNSKAGVMQKLAIEIMENPELFRERVQLEWEEISTFPLPNQKKELDSLCQKKEFDAIKKTKHFEYGLNGINEDLGNPFISPRRKEYLRKLKLNPKNDYSIQYKRNLIKLIDKYKLSNNDSIIKKIKELREKEKNKKSERDMVGQIAYKGLGSRLSDLLMEKYKNNKTLNTFLVPFMTKEEFNTFVSRRDIKTLSQYVNKPLFIAFCLRKNLTDYNKPENAKRYNKIVFRGFKTLENWSRNRELFIEYLEEQEDNAFDKKMDFSRVGQNNNFYKKFIKWVVVNEKTWLPKDGRIVDAFVEIKPHTLEFLKEYHEVFSEWNKWNVSSSLFNERIPIEAIKSNEKYIDFEAMDTEIIMEDIDYFNILREEYPEEIKLMFMRTSSYTARILFEERFDDIPPEYHGILIENIVTSLFERTTIYREDVKEEIKFLLNYFNISIIKNNTQTLRRKYKWFSKYIKKLSQ